MSDKLVAQQKAYDAAALVEGLKREARVLRQCREDLENELENLRIRIKELESYGMKG